MAQDASAPSTTDLPEGVGNWITDLARERGISEEELLSRLLGASVDAPDAEAVHDRFEAIQAGLADLEERVDDIDADLEEKISDVRGRVIQVKREADAKAEADHAHPDIVSDVGDVAADVDALADDVEELEGRLEAATGDVAAETEQLGEEVDALSTEVTRKLNVLGAAVVEMRDQVRVLLAEHEKRALLGELRTSANRNGVRTAKCENCSRAVDIGLLAEPRCPHCDEAVEELDPKDGFFGSHVLRTGRPPELEGDTGPAESELDDVVEE